MSNLEGAQINRTSEHHIFTYNDTRYQKQRYTHINIQKIPF